MIFDRNIHSYNSESKIELNQLIASDISQNKNNFDISETTRLVIERLESREKGPVFSNQTTSASSLSAMRNYSFILNYLKPQFSKVKKVFEPASGTGHHACIFATELPHLKWQPSDKIKPYLEEIQETISYAKFTTNVLPPIQFSVEDGVIPSDCDAVYMSNTLHCMSDENTKNLITKVGNTLPNDGLLAVYGPLNTIKDQFATALNDGEGNKKFDAKLKAENPKYGIKNLEDINTYATKVGLNQTDSIWHKEANNYLVFFKKAPAKLKATENTRQDEQKNISQNPASICLSQT